MIEANPRKIIEEYSDIIKLIEKLEITEEENISKLKAKLRFFDGTIFWIREISIKEKIEAYSYYWLRPDETIIMGWDNTPHHKELNSFPHHRHLQDKIESSQERNLTDVLNFIRKFFGQ